MAFLEKQRLMASEHGAEFSLSDIPPYFSVTGLVCFLGLLYMCKRCTGRTKQKQEETKRIVGIIGGLVTAFAAFFIAKPFLMPPKPAEPSLLSYEWLKKYENMQSVSIPALMAVSGFAAYSFFKKSGGSKIDKTKKLKRKKHKNQQHNGRRKSVKT